MTPQLPYPPSDGQTHWEGCYRSPRHHNCAVLEADAQAQKLAETLAMVANVRLNLSGAELVTIEQHVSRAKTAVRLLDTVLPVPTGVEELEPLTDDEWERLSHIPVHIAGSPAHMSEAARIALCRLILAAYESMKA